MPLPARTASDVGMNFVPQRQSRSRAIAKRDLCVRQQAREQKRARFFFGGVSFGQLSIKHFAIQPRINKSLTDGKGFPMSDRKDAFQGQLITAQFYDACFEQLETADRNMTADAGFVGIYSGLGVTQNGSPNLTVNVATGTAYAPAGERMRAGTTTNVNCAIDRDGISTAVTNPINTRILAIVMRPDRVLSDPQEDAGGDTVYTQRTESYSIEVIQGAEGAPAVAPSIDADAVLLADVTLINGQTQILNASIATNDRRDDQIVVAGSPLALRVGKVPDAFSAVVARYNNHVGGFADAHDSGDVSYGGSGFWADGSTTVAAGPVDTAISEIVSDLASTTTSDAGGQRIGVQQDASVAPTIAASTLQARLVALRLATNHYYTGGPAWADSSSGPASGTVEAAIDSIVSTIAASTGAQKMGMAAVGNFGAGTVQAMVAQLAATTSSNDGALRIGAQTVVGSPDSLAGTTARGQLSELLTLVNARVRKASAETITAKMTFDLASDGVGIETAADTTCDFNGEVEMPRVNVGVQSVGVIAANTQILNNVGLVICQCPAVDNDNYNLAMPAPASGNPIIAFKFYGGAGVGPRRVWLTTTAEIGTSPPTNYYAYWDTSAGSNQRASAMFAWDGTRWRLLSATSLTGTTGGGTLAE